MVLCKRETLLSECNEDAANSRGVGVITVGGPEGQTSTERSDQTRPGFAAQLICGAHTSPITSGQPSSDFLASCIVLLF